MGIAVRGPAVSYVALATDRFDEVVRFYADGLGLPAEAAWDRPHGRGRRFRLGGGLRLEILDNRRERRPADLADPAGRVHLVVEVADLEAARGRLTGPAPPVEQTSWGARLFRVADPDGVAVTFLQWDAPGGDRV